MQTRKCRQCNKYHEVYYLEAKNGAIHLAMQCDKIKKTIFIPFEPNLNIQKEKSNYLIKKEYAKGNLRLI